MKTTTAVSLRRKLGSALPLALLPAILATSGVSAAFAQKAKLELHQLDQLAGKAAEVTNVDLEGPMLKLAAEQVSTKSNQPNAPKNGALPGMLQQLKGIYVRAFEFSKPGEYSKTDLDSVLKQLEKGGWKSIVHVEEKKSGETTGIYLMEEGGATVGMAIVAAEPKELTIVNLVGPINFSQLGALGSLGALGQLANLPGNTGNGKPQSPGASDSKPKTSGESN